MIKKNRRKNLYYVYLNSKEWEEKRVSVLERENNKCQKCNTSDNLQIHHWTYTRLFNEELSDLYCLCKDCHTLLHEPYWTKDLLRVTKAFIKWEQYIPRITKNNTTTTKKKRHKKLINYRKKLKEKKNKIRRDWIKVKKRRFLVDDSVNDITFKWVIKLKPWKLWDPR